MKKGIIAFLCLTLVMLLVLTGCVKKGSISDNASQLDATNLVSGEYVTVQSNNVITPLTNAPNETTTALTADPNVDPLDQIGAEAQIFRSGKVYFEGSIFSEDGSDMPVVFASDGHNVQINVTTEGLSLGIVVIDGTTYLLMPSTKMYIEISDRVLSALGLDNFDLTSISELTNEGLEDDSTQVRSYPVTINGSAGLCTEFESPENESITKLYTQNDKLVQCDIVNKASGKTTMTVAFSTVSAGIPSDMLTLKGYEKAPSAISFLRGLVKS